MAVLDLFNKSTSLFLGVSAMFGLMGTTALLADVNTESVKVVESSESRLTYTIDEGCGQHRTKGPFTGRLVLEIKNNRVNVTQVMVFADGSEETITGRGILRGDRATVLAQAPQTQKPGAAGALQGFKRGRAKTPAVRLQLQLCGDGAKTRVLSGKRVIARASAGFKPEQPDPGWTGEQAKDWHHKSVGTEIIPYQWFLALEQPDKEALFRADDYMTGMGFIPSTPNAQNPDGLPIGFARYVDEAKKTESVGFSCSACHTAEVQFAGEPLRIEGGRGSVNVPMFQSLLGMSLAATGQGLRPDAPPAAKAKFGRFAQRVLKDEFSPETMQQLGAALGQFLMAAKKRKEAFAALGITRLEAGYGRLDALGGGPNTLFGKLSPKNIGSMNAPVRIPHMWGTDDLDWVQYNGSIGEPLTRNILVSLATGAQLTLTGAAEDRFESSVKIQDIYQQNQVLRSIDSPKWPGRVDHRLWKRGKRLYAKNCASCHDTGRNDAGFVKVRMSPLSEIGTDPATVTQFNDRKIDLSALGHGTVSLGEALQITAVGVMERQFKESGFDAATKAKYNGDRKVAFRSILAYRARPLEGTWAGGPYLHNGSVRTLYQLLSPVSERDKTFNVGPRPVIDRVQVGVESAKPGPGVFQLDTSKPGNRNTGHEFRDGSGKGVIGPCLKPADRRALVEYVKTL